VRPARANDPQPANLLDPCFAHVVVHTAVESARPGGRPLSRDPIAAAMGNSEAFAAFSITAERDRAVQAVLSGFRIVRSTGIRVPRGGTKLRKTAPRRLLPVDHRAEISLFGPGRALGRTPKGSGNV
jgi:hypothetical protein